MKDKRAPEPKFYLVPPRPETATTGEAPFFTMDPAPVTATRMDEMMSRYKR
jgi:hypothetical protein